jgi:hypothetical protein
MNKAITFGELFEGIHTMAFHNPNGNIESDTEVIVVTDKDVRLRIRNITQTQTPESGKRQLVLVVQ